MLSSNVEMQLENYRKEKEARLDREMRRRLSVACSAEEMLARLCAMSGLNVSERAQKTAV